jgi:hypothetical protein
VVVDGLQDGQRPGAVARADSVGSGRRATIATAPVDVEARGGPHDVRQARKTSTASGLEGGGQGVGRGRPA